MALSFSVQPQDAATIEAIASRAARMDRNLVNGSRARKRVEWQMDFTACHASGNPLRLADLLAADDVNFAHDAFGIARHLDRSTGELTGFFSPRYSERQAEAA